MAMKVIKNEIVSLDQFPRKETSKALASEKGNKYVNPYGWAAYTKPEEIFSVGSFCDLNIKDYKERNSEAFKEEHLRSLGPTWESLGYSENIFKFSTGKSLLSDTTVNLQECDNRLVKYLEGELERSKDTTWLTCDGPCDEYIPRRKDRQKINGHFQFKKGTFDSADESLTAWLEHHTPIGVSVRRPNVVWLTKYHGENISTPRAFEAAVRFTKEKFAQFSEKKQAKMRSLMRTAHKTGLKANGPTYTGPKLRDVSVSTTIYGEGLAKNDNYLQKHLLKFTPQDRYERIFGELYSFLKPGGVALPIKDRYSPEDQSMRYKPMPDPASEKAFPPQVELNSGVSTDGVFLSSELTHVSQKNVHFFTPMLSSRKEQVLSGYVPYDSLGSEAKTAEDKDVLARTIAFVREYRKKQRIKEDVAEADAKNKAVTKFMVRWIDFTLQFQSSPKVLPLYYSDISFKPQCVEWLATEQDKWCSLRRELHRTPYEGVKPVSTTSSKESGVLRKPANDSAKDNSTYWSSHEAEMIRDAENKEASIRFQNEFELPRGSLIKNALAKNYVVHPELKAFGEIYHKLMGDIVREQSGPPLSLVLNEGLLQYGELGSVLLRECSCIKVNEDGTRVFLHTGGDADTLNKLSWEYCMTAAKNLFKNLKRSNGGIIPELFVNKIILPNGDVYLSPVKLPEYVGWSRVKPR
jgi:hypothetical protein